MSTDRTIIGTVICEWHEDGWLRPTWPRKSLRGRIAWALRGAAHRVDGGMSLVVKVEGNVAPGDCMDALTHAKREFRRVMGKLASFRLSEKEPTA